MKADRSEYLEYLDPARNHDKFYQATRFGNSVCFQWGRCGTKGQSKIEEFATEWQASNAMDEKLEEKKRKGYHAASGNAPLPKAFFKAVPPLEPKPKTDADSDPESESSQYFLQWKTTRPITPDALKEAAVLAGAILARCGAIFPQELTLLHAEDAPAHTGRASFYRDGEKVADFGYPPMSFLDSLSSRERKAVMELGTSRDGWLSNNGTGQGIITTGKSLFDFPVRLFLSVLSGRCGLEVSCSDEQKYHKGLTVTVAHESFEWHPFWGQLKPIVEEQWLVHGSTRIIFTAPAAEGERRYAW